MSDNFAFLLPVIMAVFGCAFLLVWRSGPRAALFWGVGYLMCAAAFACPLILARCTDAVQSVAADTLFAFAFFCFAQALRVRFARPRAIAVNVALCGSAIAASVLSVLWFDSLRLELMSVQILCSMPAVVALVSIRRSARRPIDRALVAIAAINVLNNIVSGATAPFTTATDDFAAYMSSSYAFIEQASAAIISFVFGLVALAAVTLDVVARYRTEALTDPLTGLWNRRGFEDATLKGARTAVPQGSLIICDIDHFKRVNDTLGHAAGDRVIKTIADVLAMGLPPGAVLARFGGEEFIIYLPAPHGEAHLLANQLCGAIADRAATAAGLDWPLTASFGIAVVESTDASLHDAIVRADRRLYDAKLAGRNRVAGAVRAA